ncbi:hypothetical protein PIB19_10985 [Sphingomonas sp. 7/4-4]|uniref:hypothetical protein n=1 Tax=Sphingomonas sp. 7/4-4 TaxID=3018446 RepID=UPI0022F3AA85|nr:hypothetical protein [Sphingomonas sp. 7/4-4]WBY09752.1 hypothetical protein PIB19_10985 [Sphingomonas sp. 7/4-4]
MKSEEISALLPAPRRAAICLAIGLAVLAIPQGPLITRWLFLHQDLQAGIALIACWLLAWWIKLPLALPLQPPRLAFVLGAAAVFALGLWAGAHALMLDYPLTRDELMAGFDQANFTAGRLSALLPTVWTGYGLALVPDFLLDVPGQALLASAYGPVNSAMRAAFGFVADPALLNPLLAAAGLIALHRIARRLFADSPGAQWLVLIGYVLSAQIAVNAMTSYAMTAHLAFNLIWLALFLRDKWWSHMLAALVGALAIGLHQVVFHPLFAGPFILWLLRERRWRLFAGYAAVYFAALGFWMSWPQMVTAAGGMTAHSGSIVGAGGFVTNRVLPLLFRDRGGDLSLMFYNLVRAVVWNAAFLLPCVLLAIPAVRRREGLTTPLAAGVLLTIFAMTILLAYQGHGWGYRYIHGLLGNCLLLAGYGYRELARREERVATGFVAFLTAATLPIADWLLATTHGFVAPYARLSALIARQDVDFVIVDTNGPGFAMDQVRNRPDLSNRPLIFSSAHLTPAQVTQLCDRGTIALVGRSVLRSGELFLARVPAGDPQFNHQVAPLDGRNCVRPGVR